MVHENDGTLHARELFGLTAVSREPCGPVWLHVIWLTAVTVNFCGSLRLHVIWLTAVTVITVPLRKHEDGHGSFGGLCEVRFR